MGNGEGRVMNDELEAEGGECVGVKGGTLIGADRCK